MTESHYDPPDIWTTSEATAEQRRMSLDRQAAGQPPNRATGSPGCASSLSFLLDLDGTLLRGQTPAPGASELIRLIEGRFVVVSNNSTHSACDMAAELASGGLEVPEERLVLAGAMAVRLVARDYPGARVLLVGSAGLGREAEEAGLDLVYEKPDIVLLGCDLGFTYDKLTLVANELQRGGLLVATNPDTSHPGVNGALIPETGTLMHAIISCARPRAVRVIGKPEPDLFQEALRRLGKAPRHSVVIGDNPETDAAGAMRLGIPYLLIGAGSDCDARDLYDLVDKLATDKASMPAISRLR